MKILTDIHTHSFPLSIDGKNTLSEMTESAFNNKIFYYGVTDINKNKILEVNSAVYDLPRITLPGKEIARRYYEIGGKNISYGSDAHSVDRILDKREEVVKMLKKIGFDYLTVPIRGEYIKVEI